MNWIQLLAELQKLPQSDYDRIVGLINANKSVFDKSGLRPNAIACIDMAVAYAKRIITKNPKGAYADILLTYDMFTTVLNAVERTNYWSSERVTGKHTVLDVAHHSVQTTLYKPFEGPYNAENAAESRALRKIFDTYVKAKLLQHNLLEYLDALRIVNSVRI